MKKLEKEIGQYKTTDNIDDFNIENEDVLVVETEDGDEFLAIENEDGEIVLLVSAAYGEYLTEDDLNYGDLFVDTNNYIYSKEYIENNYYEKCSNCGKWFEEGRGIYTEDTYEFFCDDCVKDANVAFQCDDCGKWFSSGYFYNYGYGAHGENEDGDEVRYCGNCSQYYYTCDNCGCIIHQDDAFYIEDEWNTVLCRNCYEEKGGDIIKSYHFDGSESDYDFKYYVTTSRQTDPLISPEWEIDCGGLNGENAQEIIDAIGGEDFVLAQRDGSLNNGFEIVPAPADLYQHKNVFNWRDGMATALRLGYKAHDPGTCGLHIHIDREFFEDCGMSQDRVEDCFWISLMNNIEWIKKFSRRTDFGYCVVDENDEKIDTIEKAEEKVKNINKRNRYKALNFSRSDTIEIRIFRGTCNIDTFYATLELVDIWARLIKRCNDLQDAMKITLSDFLREYQNNPGKYEYLERYLIKRAIIEDSNSGF